MNTKRGWFLAVVLGLAVAQAQERNLFVANQGGNTIREFSPSGVDLGDFATTGLNGPTGLAFDRSGNLFELLFKSDLTRGEAGRDGSYGDARTAQGLYGHRD